MGTNIKTTERVFRGNHRDAEAATVAAVNCAGREGLDIYDVRRVRRAPNGTTHVQFIDGEFVRCDEWIVVLRVMA